MNAAKTGFRRAAFTLIELLVVITIIAMLLALGAPAVLNSIKSSRLTGAGEKLLGALSEAQQTAFAQNQAVEVRFYKFPGTIGNDPQFRGYQFFRIAIATVAVPATKPGGKDVKPGDEVVARSGPYNRLPENVMISADSSPSGLSPMLDGAGLPDSENDSGVANATYVAIRFLTDGTCRRVNSAAGGLAILSFLSLPQSYLTVIEDDGKPYTGAEPPKNFYTVQTDPFTGKSRSYRPGF
jgi:uncharacterized protein (TIGR02596 family)